MSADRTLVTGFLAFEGFDVNPSALLAEGSGRRFELLEVSYAAVDAFLDRLDQDSFDRWLMLGVAGKSSRMRMEMLGRNAIGERGDVKGDALVGEIESGGPAQIAGKLWRSQAFAMDTQTRRRSADAGDYLCNYLYYRGLRKFDGAGKPIGFLHVPPLERMPIETQLAELADILRIIETD